MSSIDGISGVDGAGYAEYPQHSGTSTGAPESGIDFSSIINDALRDEAMRAGITTGAGSNAMLNGFMPMQVQTQGIEQMILAAASSGDVDDAKIALLMLCMMMQSGGGEGDYSMLMQMMASMVDQFQGDEGTLRNSVMTSGYEHYILDTIDWNVFGTSFPGPSGSGTVVLPLEFWRPTTPAITSNEADRSPERYHSVIAQFRVEAAERYRPGRNGYTYCNIYVWDVTTAMGAELPYYTDPVTGEPRYFPNTQGAKAMLAKEMDAWLKTHGATYGWRQVDEETAQYHANEGRPAVASGGSIDHISMIRPSRDGGYDPIRGVAIAQAGSRVTSYTYISNIYGTNARANQVTYWIHD